MNKHRLNRFQKQITQIILLLAICYLPLAISYAAVPHLINYQARLTDSSGSPLNGSYQLTFRIYDAETAGNLLWEEKYTGEEGGGDKIVIQKGVFSVLLGSVTNLDLPFDKPYFLEIKVGNEVMSPRQRITSAGYAIRAENSEKLNGIEVKTTPAPNSLLALDSNAKLPAGQGILGNVITIQQANGTIDISTSSTTFVDMTDMSLSVVVATGDIVIIDFSCAWDYGGANAGNAHFQLLRDSTVLQKAAEFSANSDYTSHVGMQYVDTPSAATYTYKVQWKSPAGGQNDCNASSLDHHRNLRVIKIKASS